MQVRFPEEAMSRFVILIIAVAALFSGSSCVPSFHGIATDENAIFKPELVNSWTSDDGESAWVFESDNDRSYSLALITPDGLDGTFYAALVELEGELFLDIFPSDSDANWPLTSFYGLHFVPVHTFMHVELGEDTLSLRMMDPSWMDAWLQTKPDGVSHVRENMTVLTASTPELQALLPTLLDEEPITGAGMMGNDASAFTDPVVLSPGEIKTREELDEEMQQELQPRETTEPAPVAE